MLNPWISKEDKARNGDSDDEMRAIFTETTPIDATTEEGMASLAPRLKIPVKVR